MEFLSINLGSLSPALEGVLSFDLEGKGRLGKDVVSGKFSISPLLFRPFKEAEAEGDIKLDITEESIEKRAGTCSRIVSV